MGSVPGLSPFFNLLAVPASILGNEVALRIGRRRWIMIAMAGSGASGIVLGLGAGWHWAIVAGLLVAYSMLVMAESATLTAGLVAAALDAAGGAASVAAWAIAYAAIGAGCLAAPLVSRIKQTRL